MGLDTTHDCWHGAYSAFHRWRMKIAELAGYGALDSYEGFGGSREWPAPDKDPLVILLTHSDCDGEIRWQDCDALADALERLIPSLEVAGDGGGHIGSYAATTRQFIDGLREAAEAKEDVGFH